MAGHILLVEDNFDNRVIFAMILRHHGFDVTEAPDGESALDALAAEPLPDLVLLDIGLPGIDGLKVAKVIRGSPRTRHLPIIAVTAHTFPEDRSAMLRAGCDSILSKPVEPTRLLQRVNEAMDA